MTLFSVLMFDFSSYIFEGKMMENFVLNFLTLAINTKKYLTTKCLENFRFYKRI